MSSGKTWVNRLIDDRSRPFHIFIAAGAAVGYLILALVLYALNIDAGTINQYGFIVLVPAMAGMFVFSLGFIIFLSLVDFHINPSNVPEGHVGLIKFRGHYTNEITAPGPVMLPFGYDVEAVDCRQFTLESDLLEVRSRDGFVVKANLTAWLKVSNPKPYVTGGFSKDEMKKLLRSALFSAASRKNALDIVGDRDQICSEAVKEVSQLSLHYGVDVTKVAIDVQSIPEELTSFVQMLSILEKRYPTASPSELIETIMVSSGKITKSRSEVTNINRFEMPGLEAVTAAAARRFS